MEANAPLSRPATSGGPDAFVLAKAALMALILGSLSAPVFCQAYNVRDAEVSGGTWALVIASALANIAVIAYHYIVPPHPKFLMLPGRRWTLRVHIVSGTVELVAGLWAAFGHSPKAALVQAAAGLFFHVPSALLQTPIVFGSKALMTPAYLLCIGMHAFCAATLLTRPDSTYWAVQTFLVFNIYVWCRVYFYAFDWARLFQNAKYTVAILAAGGTMVPAAFGPTGFLFMALFILAYLLLYRWLFLRGAADYAEFVRERGRDAAIDRDETGSFAPGRDEASDARAARQAFDALDEDRAGQIGREELTTLLATWNVPGLVIEALLARALGHRPAIDFDGFRRNIWSVGALRARARRVGGVRRGGSERDHAQFVFEQMDLDADGAIGRLELDLLMLEWGLPTEEATRYLERVDKDGDGKISFDEFFRHMRPVWRYVFHDVYRADDAARSPEMLSRSVASMTEAAATRQMRDTVRGQLLARVPFLAGASEQLVQDLAASLETTTHPAGDVLFREGDAGDRFYLVGSGSLRVTKGGETISDLGLGACVGEGALLGGQRRSATVTLLGPSTLHSMSRASFDYVTSRYPGVLDGLRRLDAQRQSPQAASA